MRIAHQERTHSFYEASVFIENRTLVRKRPESERKRGGGNEDEREREWENNNDDD